MTSIHEKFQVSPLRKCGISVAHISMPDHANGLTEEGMDVAVEKSLVHSQGLEVRQG